MNTSFLADIFDQLQDTVEIDTLTSEHLRYTDVQEVNQSDTFPASDVQEVIGNEVFPVTDAIDVLN